MAKKKTPECLDYEGFARLVRNPRIKKIGWGTGSCFRLPHWPKIKLDYVIDSKPTMWGTTVNGVPVRSPEALRDEDPRRTAVVIYSQFFSEIIPAIGARGAFPYATIFAYNWYTDCLKRLQSAAALVHQPLRISRGKRRHAFVMQGPVSADYTLTLLDCLRRLNPDAHLILSTWDDTSPALLERARSLADYVVTGPHPVHKGPQNVNRQILSTQRGLELARELRVETVLKIRTDAAPLAPRVFDACTAAAGLYSTATARKHGLRGRLFIPETFTRKYIPYHPSDLVMWGHLEDVQRYWSAPFNPGNYDIESPEWKAKSVAELTREGPSAEGYLGVSFAKRTGWRVKYTVHDAWALLRDLFVVQDNNWFQLVWAKRIQFDPIRHPNPLHECLSHYTWQQFVWGTLSFADEDRGVDIGRRHWGEFYNPRYRPRRSGAGNVLARTA